MTSNTTTPIKENAKAITKTKNLEMTMSTVSGFTNANTNANTNTTTKTKPKIKKATTKPMETQSFTITKRSLSESSAEEYHRSSEATSRSSSNQRKMWHNELIINPESEERQPKWRQRPNNDVEYVNKRNRNYFISDMIDVGIRIVIVVIFIKLETTKAFQRNIHVEELWLYKNPRTDDIVSPAALILSVIIGPFIVTLLQLYFTRNGRDFRAANWTWTLSLCLNGVTTSLLKISTGRPRPDFFYRCFPDGQMMANVTPTAVNFNCTGKWRDINEGYKSFPSGHASFAFTSFGFIALYLAGKLHAFNITGRGESWRLFASVWPLFIAALVAVSRTCDYHHHWQDVLVGALIGTFVAYLTYRQYYPSIFSPHSHRPLPRDGKYIINHENGHESRHNKSDNIDNTLPSSSRLGNRCTTKSKDDHLTSDDQMPLICDEDDVNQLNN